MYCLLAPFAQASQFIPFGYCMRWNAGLIWLHVLSDLLIYLAYASIPIVLLRLVRKRKDITSRWMMVVFAIFIVACGATHILGIMAIWKPVYRIEGIVKLITAVSLIATACYLRALIPKLIQLPSIEERQRAHSALTGLNEELEKRTAELNQSYASLQASNAKVRKNESQFRQFADSMPQIVWTAEPDGRVDYYNEHWYSFTGFDRNLTGDQSWLPLLHPDDIERRYKAWYASVRSGLPFKEEYRFFDRSTATYRWHLGRAVPIKDESGSVMKWIGACSDVDDYKRVEAAILTMNTQLETRVAERTRELLQANDELRRTQSWLQAVLQSATEVSIMALDNNGVITFFNSGTERLLGFRAEEIVGKVTPRMFYPLEQSESRARQLSAELKRTVTVDEIFLAANQTPGSYISEAVYLHRDGTPIDISLAISPIIDSNGDRLGKLSIAVDMRPRKLLEQQLTQNNLQLQLQTQKAEEASRAKSQFLSAVSHEIRTPMNAILGMADLLWETELGESQRRYVEVFRRACSNLLALVNDILDLSKIESGGFELERIDFDLREIIALTLEMIHPKAQAKGLRLNSHIADNIPLAVVGDPTRLQQILSNLLTNAVKFTQAGDITLTLRSGSTDPDHLYFEISDTGIGIPEDKLEKIFEDFTQAESSTTRRFGGTGLGLGICKRLVKRMGGDLTVQSQFGLGSTFSFDAVFTAGSTKERSPSEVISLSGQRVLIVDDNAIDRLALVEMCTDGGMQTSELDGAAYALSSIQNASHAGHPFQLVIIDGLIGQVDAVQLATDIRATFPALPLLVITSNRIPADQNPADQNPGDQEKVLNLGASEYATKPVRRPELLRLVCKLLRVADPKTAERPLLAGRTIRLLVAEDSEDNRFLLQEYLKSDAYDVAFVENGQRAVDLATSQSFDLVFMDVQMPVMDGLAAIRLIRDIERGENRVRVPIVALTANAHAEDVALSYAAGGDGHIAKPISKLALLAVIGKQLNQSGSSRESVSMPRPPDTLPVPAQLPHPLLVAARNYIRSRDKEIIQLRALLSQSNFDQIQVCAHDLKRSGETYQLSELIRLGQLIESSALSRDADLLSSQLIELSRYVQAAEEQLLTTK